MPKRAGRHNVTRECHLDWRRFYLRCFHGESVSGIAEWRREWDSLKDFSKSAGIRRVIGLRTGAEGIRFFRCLRPFASVRRSLHLLPKECRTKCRTPAQHDLAFRRPSLAKPIMASWCALQLPSSTSSCCCSCSQLIHSSAWTGARIHNINNRQLLGEKTQLPLAAAFCARAV